MMFTYDVVKAMAEVTGGTQKDAKVHLDALKTVVVEALKRGEDVELRGFVNFTSRKVEEGTARNPRTGEEVVVPAHRKAKASLAKKLRKL